MPNPPAKPAPQKALSVRGFYNTHKDTLKLDLIAGDAGLGNLIREGTVNRPALALTGFFKYFANKRVQVFGSAEVTYLKTLPTETQSRVINEMIDRGIPCIVLTRNYTPPPALLAAARERNLPLFRTPIVTMRWVNIATLRIDDEFAPSRPEHGTMLDVKGMGVLIRGDSGIGKSECALALIERGHAFVADDFTVIKLVGERELIASSPERGRGYMECRGIGIINIADMFGVKSVRAQKRLDMVVSLRAWQPGVIEERTGLDEHFYEIHGLRIPHIEIYVRPGRDIARMVEIAVMVQLLKNMGVNPAQKFNDHL
ncbi:MAG: HPr(Ser) kinase/phosphatase, partial [Opitutaceae bacterium]|nr:HPr(Ser) kinase/phosphatase [Opitutaceae bacterium]